MKIAVAAVAALAAGVLGGTVVGAVRAKADVLEAVADSLAAASPADDHAPAWASVDDEPVVEADPAEVSASEVDTAEAAPPDSGTSEDESHEADASQADSARGDGPVEPDSEGGGEPGGLDVSADPGSSEAAGTETAALQPSRSAADSAAAREEGARKLSKIFGAMKAADAAAVLSELTDGEIEVILRYMSERLAAPILEAFDPARAAALSRIVLRSGGDGS